MVGLRGHGRSDYTPYLGIPERRRRLYPYSILPLQSPYTANTLVRSYSPSPSYNTTTTLLLLLLMLLVLLPLPFYSYCLLLPLIKIQLISPTPTPILVGYTPA